MSAADKLRDSAFAALDALHRERASLPTWQPLMSVAHAGLRLCDEDCEHLLAYWLDGRGRLLGSELIAKGSEMSCDLSRSHIARRALAAGAESAILCHNHPSGRAEASQQDAAAADRIDAQLSAIGLLVIGHYVVAEDGYGDIRTGTVTSWASLTNRDQPAPEAPRCRHCNGALEQSDAEG